MRQQSSKTFIWSCIPSPADPFDPNTHPSPASFSPSSPPVGNIRIVSDKPLHFAPPGSCWSFGLCVRRTVRKRCQRDWWKRGQGTKTVKQLPGTTWGKHSFINTLQMCCYEEPFHIVVVILCMTVLLLEQLSSHFIEKLCKHLHVTNVASFISLRIFVSRMFILFPPKPT